MPARLFLSTLCIVLVTAPAFAKEKVKQAEAPDTVACDGVFGPQSSEALLIETFGKDNVVTGQVYGPEGMEMLATTVFPNDPQRSMQFGWWDEENLTDLNYVDLSPSQIGPKGIRIGMPVADVAAINEEPFQVGGFWWDYGGYANIETGALTNLDGGCYLSIRFAPTEEYPEDTDVTAVSGEVQVPSDEPLLETLDVRVQVLSMSYPGPEGGE
jgi:hypothetical protein